MKEFDHIDELIRQKFEGFEPVPPESVWEKVREGIGPDQSSPKGGLFTPPIITGLIVLLGLVSLLFLISRVESTLPAATAGSPEIAYAADHLSSRIATADQLAEAVQATSDLTPSASIPVKMPVESAREYASYHPESQSSSISAEGQSAHIAGSRESGRFMDDLDKMNSRNGGTIDLDGAAQGPDRRDSRFRKTSDDYAAPVKPLWSVGAFFNPEMSFNSTDGSGSPDYGFQILPRVSFGNWFVESGLGVRTGGDHGNAVISYNKFLGSYEDVYEVTFDSTESGVVPTYHTRMTDVYDTVPYYSISQTNVRYTYLDIPIQVGREWKFNRFTLSLHAGPTLSILAGRSSPVTDYPDERIRILSESPQIPARETINWQLTAGAGFGYKLSDNLSFSLEPTFRYFLSGQYQESDYNQSQPYSLGVRAGLIYNINH